MNEYLAKERPAAASEPLFQVQYKWYGGEKKTRRMSGQRVWKIIKDLGKRVGVDTIHPHAFRHACGVELLKRSGGNLRAVQEHLRHADIQTTIYTRLAPQDLQKVVNLFDEKTEALRARGLRTGGPPKRDSNPCLSLERASPWVVISPTSTPGATARCHSRRGIVPRIHLLFVDLGWSTKSRAIPKSRFVRSAAAYPQRHAEGPVGQSWSRAGLTTLGCCDGDPSRNPSADRRFAEAFCFVPLAGVGWLWVEPGAQRPRT